MDQLYLMKMREEKVTEEKYFKENVNRLDYILFLLSHIGHPYLLLWKGI